MTFLPVVVLAIAAAFPPLRIPALVFLGAGFAVAWRRERREIAAWAGTIPIAISLAFGLIPLLLRQCLPLRDAGHASESG
jgi:hypothetical protein